MATIIDSLVVKLGLDSRDLSNQAPSGVGRLRDIEQQGDKTEASISGLSSSLGKFLALLGGTIAIKKFVEDTTDLNAALERLSKNLGIEVSTISAWGNAVEQAGGNAKSLQGTLQMLTRAQTDFKVTGESSLIPYFSALGLSFADFARSGKPVTDWLLSIQDALKRTGLNRTDQFNFLKMMGIDDGTANVLLSSSRKELELFIQKQKEFNAVTPQQAENAVKLQKSFIGFRQEMTAVGRELLSQATPALLKLLDVLTELGNWVQQNMEFIKDLGAILGSVAVGLGAIAVLSSPLTLTVGAVLALAAGIALLWQDYQTWKRGGDSLIPWGKWKAELEPAIQLVERLGKGLENLWQKAKQFYKSYDPKAVNNSLQSIGVIDKPKNTDANYIKQFFQKQGWSASQAAGIAANVMSESGGNPRAIGDNGQALGLAQWHPDRQRDFAALFGHDLNSATVDEQLMFIQYELTQGKYKSTGNQLRGVSSANAAGAIVSKGYERPADAAGEALRRGNLAASIAGIPGASDAAAGADGASPVNVDRSVTNHIGEIRVYTQSTDAKGIAGDIGNEMDYLFTSQATTGVD